MLDETGTMLCKTRGEARSGASGEQAGKQRFLIVSTAARFLAEAATAGGCDALVVDAFADLDTRRLARRWRRAPATQAGFDGDALLDACGVLLAGEAPVRGIVVGAGLDGRADLLRRLAARARLYANDPEVFALCADRPRFMRFAARLGIAVPPVARGAPAMTRTSGATGGGHARLVCADDAAGGAPGACRRAYLPGCAISHQFAADGRRHRTAGVAMQWPSRHAGGFHYGGAINRAPLAAAHRDELERHAARLCAALALRGVNNADYVLCGGRLYLLELNPRPGATLQLHDDDTPGGLFAAHVAACEGRLPPSPAASPARAHAVIYAARASARAAGRAWPAGAADVPAQARFAAGEPVCTLRASGANAALALARLQAALRQLLSELAPEAAA